MRPLILVLAILCATVTGAQAHGHRARHHHHQSNMQKVQIAKTAAGNACMDSFAECLAKGQGASVVSPPESVSGGRPARIIESSHARGLVTVATAAGAKITVAASVADRMQGFIADVVARGFHGPIHCYANGGHVRHSNHYWGGACDFAQRGWGKTVAVMYHVRDLVERWGLRDGCTFRDCGHIDAPRTRMAGRLQDL